MAQRLVDRLFQHMHRPKSSVTSVASPLHEPSHANVFYFEINVSHQSDLRVLHPAMIGVDESLAPALEAWAQAEFTRMDTMDPETLAQFVVAILSKHDEEAALRERLVGEMSEFMDEGTRTHHTLFQQ
jgi:hypothetical protein